ncbi:MAG TPA: hypothetical protein VFK06_01935, partial [Candidatus Angelobacter sp.]|nr:hypothetical protein [Candidatus Angelobacter sp.]
PPASQFRLTRNPQSRFTVRRIRAYHCPNIFVNSSPAHMLSLFRVSLIGYVLNLTNETFGFYQGSEQFPIQREYYNRTYTVGLRWALGREH